MVGKTDKIGNITEARILAELVQEGFDVLVPFGEGLRYDLLIDRKAESFTRIQCKTGKLIDGVVRFNAYSVSRAKKNVPYTPEEIDYFACFCPQTNEVYYVPVREAVQGTVYLRVEPARNNQSKGIKHARDYMHL